MSIFKYSSEELEVNKVLKMNQDMSRELKNDSSMKQARKTADDNIAASMELLRQLGKGKEVERISAEIAERGPDRKLEHRT